LDEKGIFNNISILLLGTSCRSLSGLASQAKLERNSVLKVNIVSPACKIAARAEDFNDLDNVNK